MTEKNRRHSLSELRVQISFDVVRLREKIVEHSRSRRGVIGKRLKNIRAVIALKPLKHAKNIFAAGAAKIRAVRVAGYPVVLFLVGVRARKRAAGVEAFGNAVAGDINRLNVQLRSCLKRKNEQTHAAQKKTKSSFHL